MFGGVRSLQGTVGRVERKSGFESGFGGVPIAFLLLDPGDLVK